MPKMQSCGILAPSLAITAQVELCMITVKLVQACQVLSMNGAGVYPLRQYECMWIFLTEISLLSYHYISCMILLRISHNSYKTQKWVQTTAKGIKTMSTVHKCVIVCHSFTITESFPESLFCETPIVASFAITGSPMECPQHQEYSSTWWMDSLRAFLVSLYTLMIY